MAYILIVGGAGYIGSHVNYSLLDAGYRTIVFDNLSKGRQSNVPKESIFIKGDILSKRELQKVFSQYSIQGVIHLAALKAAGESMEIPNEYANNNIVGTLNLIQSCVEGNANNFVFSSTAAVYGEPQYLPLNEKHPTRPENFLWIHQAKHRRVTQLVQPFKRLAMCHATATLTPRDTTPKAV